MQIELVALLRGEGRSLVVQRVAEQLRAACRAVAPWGER